MGLPVGAIAVVMNGKKRRHARVIDALGNAVFINLSKCLKERGIACNKRVNVALIVLFSALSFSARGQIITTADYVPCRHECPIHMNKGIPIEPNYEAMTYKEAAETLNTYNLWRRGKIELEETPSPKKVGEAIDLAIKLLNESRDKLGADTPGSGQ